MSTDAIVILKDDHKQLKKLFRRFEAAGDDALATKAKVVEDIIEALTVHTYIENEGMYPAVRHAMPDLEDDILESYEEHHVADLLCMELVSMSPDNERYDAKVTVLIENVEHHIDEEESEWFPKVRAAITRKQLAELGADLIKLKEKSPTTPTQPSAMKKAVKAVIA